MSTRSGVLLGPRSLATITLLASLSASCGGVDEQPPPSTDDAATAAVVCGELKAFDNRVVRLVNQAVLPVQD